MLKFPESWSKLNVVLCHDWLTGMRGGERVLEILCQAFPEAPIFTMIHNPGSVSDIISSHKIKTSYLQNVPASWIITECSFPFSPRRLMECVRPKQTW